MISIQVAYANLVKQVEIPLQVDESCTVALAIERSKILELFPEIKLANIVVGINSRRVTLNTIVEADDRVEIYRPLTIDPKELRRLKAEKAGS